jgi:chromosome segregation ATPase
MAETTQIEQKTDTTAALQAEIDAQQAEIAELNATLEIYQLKNTELRIEIAGLNAEITELKNGFAVNSDSQSFVLKKIEKITAEINEKEASVDNIPAGLTEEETVAVRISRQDRINSLKSEKNKLRDLIGV